MLYQTGVWRGGNEGGRGRRFRGRKFRRGRASDRAKQATLDRQPPTARGQQTGATEQAAGIDKSNANDIRSRIQQRRGQRGSTNWGQTGGNMTQTSSG
jgi:hypothetical protein